MAIVRELCDRGAKVNAAMTDTGYTSLMAASYMGRLAIVRELCDRGANVNAARNNGFTSLIMASQNGHLAIVRELCDRGANVNAARTDNGFTSLMAASEKGHLNIVEELSSRGALIKEKDIDKLSAIPNFKNKEQILKVLEQKLKEQKKEAAYDKWMNLGELGKLNTKTSGVLNPDVLGRIAGYLTGENGTLKGQKDKLRGPLFGEHLAPRAGGWI
ncbi:ankyrin repeat domain-containing protein [bacterium]|nr:ankyrin repeat domain-containing protein [bacterium]